MKLTSLEILTIKQLVTNKIIENKQLIDECKKSTLLKDDLFFDELTKYMNIEKKLNVLYEQTVIYEIEGKD